MLSDLKEDSLYEFHFDWLINIFPFVQAKTVPLAVDEAH
jgi:hypothetical protein